MLVSGGVLQDSAFSSSCSKHGLQTSIMKFNGNICANGNNMLLMYRIMDRSVNCSVL